METIPTSELPGLSELPEIVIRLICEQLSYEDIQNLRVTCKRLKEIADQRSFRVLHLFVVAYQFERALCHTGELLGHANSLHVGQLNILKSNEFRSRFSGLLKLTIFFDSPDRWAGLKKLDLDDLHCFPDLVHLEIEGLAVEAGKLSLPNLKIVLLENSGRCCNSNSDTVLDFPRLDVLGLGYRTQARLNRETSRSVRHLHIRGFPPSSQAYESYLLPLCQKLPNLSTVAFDDSRMLDSFVLAVLGRKVSLSSLNKIRLEKDGQFLEHGQLLRNLIDLKSRPETEKIEIQIAWKVMRWYELTELAEMLDEIIPDQRSLFGQEQLWYYADNPTLDCLLPYVLDLKLLSDDEVLLAKQLIGKLRNLESLKLGKRATLDSSFFWGALNACRRIRSLEIGCDGSAQQLDQAPNYLRKLEILKLNDDFRLNNLSLDFVVKFKNLHALELAFNIEKETMSFILKNCKQLDFRLALCGVRMVTIFKRRPAIVCSKIATGHLIKSSKEIELDSIEDAIEHYYQNDLFNTPWKIGGLS